MMLCCVSCKSRQLSAAAAADVMSVNHHMTYLIRLSARNSATGACVVVLSIPFRLLKASHMVCTTNVRCQLLCLVTDSTAVGHLKLRQVVQPAWTAVSITNQPWLDCFGGAVLRVDCCVLSSPIATAPHGAWMTPQCPAYQPLNKQVNAPLGKANMEGIGCNPYHNPCQRFKICQINPECHWHWVCAAFLLPFSVWIQLLHTDTNNLLPASS